MRPIEGAPTTEVTEISAQDFIALHAAALEADEVRHNVVLGTLGRFGDEDAPPPRLWSLGAPGACALQTPGRPIALGALEARQCHALAEATRNTDYAAVGGPGHTASAFAERAARLGVEFEEPAAQFIHALRGSPRYPGATGQARLATAGDAPLLYAWMCGFQREVLPHDPPPQVAHLARRAQEGCFMFWIVNGEPVSVAAIARRTRNAAAISSVYTPPAQRGRGYAGSIVAATVELAYAQGKSMACLHTDQRNPISNRCYAKIGFVPICEAWHYPRRRGPTRL